VGTRNIKIDHALYERLERGAEQGGYASVDEFAQHLIERELGSRDDNVSDEEVKKRLKGLGYIS
jgi:hypothetical protein